MSDPLLPLLVPLLEREEALRLLVYDDGNGQPVGPGCTLKGHPTIGIGRCLDTRGITREEARYLLDNDIDLSLRDLDARLPWWRGMSPARQAALVAMRFQMGLGGLLAFKGTLAALQRGDFNAVANGMMASRWAEQTPARAARMAKIVRDG